MKEKEKTGSNSFQKRIYLESRWIASLYDQRADHYDFLVHILSLGMDIYYRKVAIKRLLIHPGDWVLDIGCGTGLDLPSLSKRIGTDAGGQVVGIDLSERMLYWAHRRIFKEKLKNVSLLLSDASDLPFETGSIQAVFCNYLLSTVSARKVMKEIFRVAMPGASMVFADDRLPSGWFASPLETIWDFFRNGYSNSALSEIELFRERLSSVKITNHHGGLIYIISGIFKG
jgi:demethylmenaquinone methyltransferase/2-methoxy-6-polyprenyl-1,4-benzoquinol methylase